MAESTTQLGRTADEREPDDDLVGRTFAGRFTIQSVIASGSMGVVYKAEQVPLGRLVALKVLRVSGPQAGTSEEYRQRFLREASTLAKLNHPNTVRVFDFGVHEGHSFLVMEYIEGPTLRELLRPGPLEPRRAIHIARQICASLLEAHQRGMVHRDLKPSNVLVTQLSDDADVVKVVDFGLVKDNEDAVEMTGHGLMLGTPTYMAPEQIRGMAVDGRADIYALGCVLFRMFTGQTPFRGGSSSAMMMAHLAQEVPRFSEVDVNPGLPDAVEWVVRRCLEKKPEKRFADVAELNRALKACDRVLADGIVAPVDLVLVDGRLQLPASLEESGSGWSSVVRGPVEPAEPTDPGVGRRRALALVAVVALGVLVLSSILGLGANWLAGSAERSARAETSAPGVPAAPRVPVAAEPAVAETPQLPVTPPRVAPVEAAAAPAPEAAPVTSPATPRPAGPKPKPVAPKPATVASKPSPAAAPEPPPAPAPAAAPAPQPTSPKPTTDLLNPWD